MKILKIDKTIAVADEVYMLSQKMHGFSKFASNQPLNKTLVDLSNLLKNNIKWALCGGLAVGAYSNPRGTQDIDIILESDNTIDTVVKLTQVFFKRNRAHALTHRQTGVEVDLVTPEFVKVEPAIVHAAIETAHVFGFGGSIVPIVTKEGLVALKLCRASSYDIGDIESIIRKNGEINLSQYNLKDKEIKLFEDIKKRVSGEIIEKEEDFKQTY
jgi:hypothetical protein